MSQFKKYLGIVTEGRDSIYNEESETIEKYISNIKEFIPEQMKRLEDKFSKDLEVSDTEEMSSLINSLKLRLENDTPSKQELSMVKELLKHDDFKKMVNKSEILNTDLAALKEVVKIKSR